MDYRDVLVHSCEQLGTSKVTARKKLALTIMEYDCPCFLSCSVFSDPEKKKQLIQLELLYPRNSFFSELLARFGPAIQMESIRTTKTIDTSCSQLFFSFTVLLSDNGYLLEKYANQVLEIAKGNLNWALENDDPSATYLLNVCNILLSVSLIHPIDRRMNAFILGCRNTNFWICQTWLKMHSSMAIEYLHLIIGLIRSPAKQPSNPQFSVWWNTGSMVFTLSPESLWLLS